MLVHIATTIQLIEYLHCNFVIFIS